MSAPNLPRITILHHKHGVSMGLCPAGEYTTDYWKRVDDHNPGDEDEYIEEIPLPQPYASAPELLEAVRLAMEWSDDGSPDSERSATELAFRDAAKSAITKATGFTP